jgi:hypothetical protein
MMTFCWERSSVLKTSVGESMLRDYRLWADLLECASISFQRFAYGPFLKYPFGEDQAGWIS